MLTQYPSLLVRGDCLEVLKQLPDHCVDSCIADPPYNMSKKKGLAWAFSRHVTMQEAWDIFSEDDYFTFSFEWIKEVSRVVKPNGNIFIFGTFHNIYLLGFIVQHLPLKIINSLLWLKPNAQPNITCRMFTESAEQLIWACNNTPAKAKGWTFNYPLSKERNGGKQMRNFWSIPVTPKSERTGNHPTQKPIALVKRIIELCTQPNDLILDPFAGTGTSGMAALEFGRRCLLIERSEDYCKVIQNRSKALSPSVTTKLARPQELSHLGARKRTQNLDARRPKELR